MEMAQNAMPAGPVSMMGPGSKQPIADINKTPLNVYVPDNGVYMDIDVNGNPEWHVILKKKEAEQAYQDEVVHRIKDVKPTKDPDPYNIQEMYLWRRWQEVIEPAYLAAISEGEIPESGTPIGSWAQMTARSAEALRKMGYKTVEEVAQMSVEKAKMLPLMNARDIPRLAKMYVEGKDGAILHKRLDDQEKTIADLQRQLAEKNGDQALARVAEAAAKGGNFAPKPVICNAKAYPSANAAIKDWNCPDSTFRKHMKEGTLDAYIDELIEMKKANGEAIPGGDPADRLEKIDVVEAAPEAPADEADEALPEGVERNADGSVTADISKL